jgi:hypothetical protein
LLEISSHHGRASKIMVSFLGVSLFVKQVWNNWFRFHRIYLVRRWSYIHFALPPLDTRPVSQQSEVGGVFGTGSGSNPTGVHIFIRWFASGCILVLFHLQDEIIILILNQNEHLRSNPEEQQQQQSLCTRSSLFGQLELKL